MITSDAGLNKLCIREGKKNKAYKDTKGIWTIGVGHTGPEVHEGLEWTDQQVLDAFRVNVKKCEKAIEDNVHVPLKQNQYDALVSFIFNIGVYAFSMSTACKLLNERCYDLVPMAMLMWNKPPEILGRRQSEAEQFENGPDRKSVV